MIRLLRGQLSQTIPALQKIAIGSGGLDKITIQSIASTKNKNRW